jgi:glycerophosphoryl diester phosphodiesterase
LIVDRSISTLMIDTHGVPRLLSLEAPSVIAHRGGSALRPENTMLAFDQAAVLGVDALECDVHLSRDDEVVVIHDATLERTTDAAGPVVARTAAELASVDAGYRFGPDQGFPYRGQGAGVPRLADLLRRHPTMPVIVEIKGDEPRTAQRTVDVLEEAGVLERVILGGFSPKVMETVRRRVPILPTGASRVDVQSALRRSYFGLAPRTAGYRVFQVPLRLEGREVLSRRFVRSARRGGIPVHAWVIDRPEDMRRLLDWGATGIITDRPDVAMGVVRPNREP